METPKNATPAQVTPTQTTSFPPIGALLSESWNLFISRLGRLFVFGLIELLAIIIIYIVAFIIGLVILAPKLSPLFIHKSANFQPLLPYIIGTSTTLLLIVIIAAIIVSALAATWMLLSLNEDKQTSIGTIFRMGFRYIIPMIGVSLLLFVIELGGFFFFIVPAILFVIFFAFTQYEVVLDNQRGITALKRSYAILTSNFGDIFVRMVIIWVISFLISSLPQLAKQTDTSILVGLTFIFVIINFFLGWYSMCYMFLVYQQAKARTDFTKPVSMLWVWIITVLGWIIFAIIAFALIAVTTSFVKSGEFTNLLRFMQTQKTQKNTLPGRTNHAAPVYHYNTTSNNQSVHFQ